MACFLAACGPSAQDGAGGSGGSKGTWTSPPAAKVACTATPVDHAMACPAPCALDVDLEVQCHDYHFASPGLRVAPAPDATWLATSSETDRMLLRADAASVTRVADDTLPDGLVRNPILLALTKANTLHLAGDTTQFVPGVGFEKGGLQYLAGNGQSWEQSEVRAASGDGMIPPTDLEIADDGTPHVWFAGGGPNMHHATRDAAGKWTIEDAPVPAGSDSWRFTLTSDGKPASFGLAAGGAMRSLVDGQDQSFGGPASGKHRPWFTLANGPRSASGPAYAVAIMHPEGIHVLWPQGGAFQDVSLPGSPRFPDNWCLDEACVDCNWKGTGVEEGGMGVGRTDDGALWVAYVVSTEQVTIHAEQVECTSSDGCNPCNHYPSGFEGTNTLHLVRVRTDGSPAKEVLALPVKRIAALDAFRGVTDNALHQVDVRGFGKDLAIGLQTTESADSFYDGDESRVRILRVDTTKLPP